MTNPVQQFFSCLASQDIVGALNLVDESATFEAQGPASVPIYGLFQGKEGAKNFLGILSDMFETEDFGIYKWADADDFVFAFGYMRHRVRKTDNIFECEWALVCQIKDGHIISYKMFEDTAALQAACA